MICHSNRPNRSGVILLVVISMLLLFSGIAIVFVLYSQAQASIARMFRETETQRHPDEDPELLLSYFLGQLIYGSNNPASPLRGNAAVLADNMYGQPGNTIPYNADRGAVPYTYPDLLNLYLAAVKAGPIEAPDPANGQRISFPGTDGAVLAQSFYRRGPNGQIVSLRPPSLPPMENRGGDVKNLHFSPGTYVPGSNPPQFNVNDSIWLDLGHPILIAPDGRRYTALFAPLVTDLDNKINVNVHGNIMGRFDGEQTRGNDLYQGRGFSHQGWGPWEVNPERVLSAPDPSDARLQEWRRLLIGDLNSGGGYSMLGRYNIRASNNNWGWPWGNSWHQLDARYTVRGPHYAPSDGDGARPRTNGMRFPGFVTVLGQQVPSYNCFPHFSDDYDGWVNGSSGQNHPIKYNFFSPAATYFSDGTGQNYQAWEMDAVLRYGDTGSPSLPSRLFRLIPRNLADPKSRRLITTHSFDFDRPGVEAQLLPATKILSRINLNRDLPQGAMGNYHQTSRYGIYATDGTYPDLMWTTFADPLDPTKSVRVTTGKTDIVANSGRFINAVKARQNFAQDLLDVMRISAGYPDPATIMPTDPAFDKLRWFAQLAVNIVDFIDIDDYITPFAWYKPNPGDPKSWQWVYGTELPRLVVNEVYGQVVNDPADPKTNNKATMDYRVCFWIELNNPLYSSTLGGQSNALPLTESGKARLRVPTQADPWKTDYCPYQIVISKDDPNLRSTTNAKGDPDTAKVQTSLTDFDWETTDSKGMPWEPLLVKMGKQYSPWKDEVNVVRPMDKYPRGVQEDHYGYYVVGPKDEFPGSDPNKPKPTLRVKEDLAAKKGLVYTLPKDQDPTQIGDQTVILRRLCCPSMPPDDNPASPTYNPYVTVDYMEGVKVNDGVEADSAGAHKARVDELKRYSIGRNQPYAAHKSQQIPQKPATALVNQPQHTMFEVNVQVVSPMDAKTMETPGREITDPPDTPPPNGKIMGFANDWLCFVDRSLISPVELMLVSQYRPHELTQQFIQGPNDPKTGAPSQRQKHLIPSSTWYDPNEKLYRMFEFFAAGNTMQWSPVGGRAIGRININTVWDREIFRALVDPQPSNFFYDPSLGNIDKMFDKLVVYRSPEHAPGPNDKPFLARGGALDIDNTFFRADPFDNRAIPPQNKRRLFEVESIDPNSGFNQGHPYVQQELLRKLFNNVTTRSNVFAVWLTVGFFEVTDEATRQLGPELGRAEGRHIRHKMFAILDRSSLTISSSVNPATMALQPQVGKVGPQPIIIPTLDQIVPGTRSVKIPRNSMLDFEGADWTIRAGDYLLVDPGPNQEIVRVTGTGADYVTAAFRASHSANISLIRVSDSQGVPAGLPGNPGPQPRFDVRNPMYQGIVRYFSVIE